MKNFADIKVYIRVPFYGYGNKVKDAKVVSGMKKWVRETLDAELSFIPIFVEKDSDGAWIEDCSGKADIKVK